MKWRLCCVIAVVSLSSCSSSESTPVDSAASSSLPDGLRVDITGAGATFPYPLYAQWFNEYAQHHGVRINYKSVGSGNGMREVLARSVDFGATDVPMSDAELSAAGRTVVHVPTVLGAVAVIYNLPALKQPLRLNAGLLADIFLGRVTRWNDARIAAVNSGAALPDLAIHVVHRSEESGTSYIMSDYLSAVSGDWAKGPGKGLEIAWPIGTDGKGNEGLSAAVKTTIGSIGYAEVVYARQNRLSVAHIQNRAGRFIAPMSFEVASASASTNASHPNSDLRTSLVDAQGDQSYPISSYTWLLVVPDDIGKRKTEQLVEFIHWALTDGTDIASQLGYVPLPMSTATHVLDQLDSTIKSVSTSRTP